MAQVQLVTFVEAALRAGQARESVRAALEQAGWSKDQVADALGHYADITFAVPVPRPRVPEQFISAEFLATKKRLEELIHPPGESAGDKLPTLRLTRVDDEVE